MIWVFFSFTTQTTPFTCTEVNTHIALIAFCQHWTYYQLFTFLCTIQLLHTMGEVCSPNPIILPHCVYCQYEFQMPHGNRYPIICIELACICGDRQIAKVLSFISAHFGWSRALSGKSQILPLRYLPLWGRR